MTWEVSTHGEPFDPSDMPLFIWKIKETRKAGWVTVCPGVFVQ